MILAIDPGPVHSAYVVLDRVTLKPLEFKKVDNEILLDVIDQWNIEHFALEMVASYGMAVGKEVFETVYWIGRFWQKASNPSYKQLIYRKDEKMNLCGSMRAKDSNIRQALIDRFGVVGTKGNKGWFYGVKSDIWAAVAVGVTYSDLYLKGTP